MWQRNPINWTNLNWLKTVIATTVDSKKETLSFAELDILRELLAVIGDDYPEHRDYARALLHRIPTGTGLLWTPSTSYTNLEDQLRRVKQDEYQLWWEVYYFLSRFEEHPQGRIIRARRPRQANLANLEEQVRNGNTLAVPEYIWSTLEQTGQPPNLKIPYVSYWCSAHGKHIFPGDGSGFPYSHRKCPRTIYKERVEEITPGFFIGREVPLNAPCQIAPQMYQLGDWLNNMMFPNNLFAFKKTQFPQPTTAKALLAAFFQFHSKHPAYLMFTQEIEDYFRNFLSVPMDIIAALNIPPKGLSYPIQAASWKAIVHLINLKTGLISGIPLFAGADLFNKEVGLLQENVSPATILSFSYVRANKGWYEYWIPRCGIVMDKDRIGNHPTKKAIVEFVTFG